MVLGKVSIKIEDGLHLVGGQLCTIEIQALEELQRWNEQRRFHRRQIVSIQVQHPQLPSIFSNCGEKCCCVKRSYGAPLQTNPTHLRYFLGQDFGIYSRQVNWIEVKVLNTAEGTCQSIKVFCILQPFLLYCLSTLRYSSTTQNLQCFCSWLWHRTFFPQTQLKLLWEISVRKKAGKVALKWSLTYKWKENVVAHLNVLAGL